jgi:hypothetical protein
MPRRKPENRHEEMHWTIDLLKREWFDYEFRTAGPHHNTSLTAFMAIVLERALKENVDRTTDQGLMKILDILTDERVKQHDQYLKDKTKREEEERRKTYTFPVICVDWLESEAGWGQRPDGCSLHMTETDYQQYEKDYWKRMPSRDEHGNPPHEYSRPCSDPFVCLVDKATFEAVKESKNGVRKWSDFKVVRATTDDVIRLMNK